MLVHQFLRAFPVWTTCRRWEFDVVLVHHCSSLVPIHWDSLNNGNMPKYLEQPAVHVLGSNVDILSFVAASSTDRLGADSMSSVPLNALMPGPISEL
jgi:hypothetical protein